MTIPHIPILRFGNPYQSLDSLPVKDHRNGEILAEISQANPGLIRRDLIKLGSNRNAFQNLRHSEILAICRKAADLFMDASLPLGVGEGVQSTVDYIEKLSATSGLTYSLCRRNMQKIKGVFLEMPKILGGLTRNIDSRVFDHQFCHENGLNLCYYPVTSAVGVVLPSNSPGVNSLWLPAVALKVPVVLKPGSEEPWTPWRIIQALIAAGCPKDAFCFYPTTHEGAEAILDCCGRSMIFGDHRTIEQYADKPHVNVHGPGYSKIVIGEDQIDQWPRFMDILFESVVANSGRSCINASTIIVPSYGKEIAEALAKRVAELKPKALNDKQALLAAIPNPAAAEYMNAAIDDGLKHSGAVDISTQLRGGPRKVQLDGSIFLNPTVVYCQHDEHPLVNREYLFPFVTVVEVAQQDLADWIGPSLVVTAVTKEQAFINQLLMASNIERLNIGPIPTTQVEWDQPHEGNLFEFLFRRRAIQFKQGQNGNP